MKITKRQIRQIIKEEKTRVLKEYWGEQIETGSDIIEFARAYSSLGDAVQRQVDAIIGAYYNGGGLESETFKETAYEQNPNAIDLAVSSLPRYSDNEEIQEIVDTLDAALSLLVD